MEVYGKSIILENFKIMSTISPEIQKLVMKKTKNSKQNTLRLVYIIIKLQLNIK